MTSLRDILAPERLTEIVDIGANPIDGEPPYRKLLEAGWCRVTGFEPQPDALDRLNRLKGPNERYLDCAIGDGTEAELKICQASGMTSLLEPSERGLGFFNLFPDFGRVVARERVTTRTLDSVAEIERMDLLKIDIQGGELSVFRNGTRLLSSAVVVQTEVSFVPLYEGQPGIGEIDAELRQLGFLPHAMPALKTWAIAPCVVNGNPRIGLNQLLEADLVYVRNLLALDDLAAEDLKHLALIAHHCYGSFDLALRCLKVLEETGGIEAGSAQLYLTGRLAA